MASGSTQSPTPMGRGQELLLVCTYALDTHSRPPQLPSHHRWPCKEEELPGVRDWVMEFAVSSNNRVKSLWVKWCERQMLLAQDWELCLPDEKKGGGLRPVPMYSRLSQLGVKDGQTLYTRKRCPIVVKDEEADDVIKIGSTLPPHTANGTASAKAIGKRKASEDEISEGRSRSWSRSPARARRRLDLERTETEDQPRAKPEQTSSPAPSTSPFTERARKRRSATYDLLLDNGLTSELTPRPRPRYVHAWSSGEGESEPEEERDEIEEALADANGVVDAAEKDGEETNGAVDASRKEAGEANATLPAREGSDVPLQSLASSTRPRTTLPLGGRPTDIRKAPNVDLAYDSLEEGELPQSSKAVPKAVPNTNSKIHTKSATNSNTRANASTDAKMSTSTNANTNTNTNTTNNSSANTNTSSDTNANMNMNTSMSAKPSTTTNAPITTTNMSASTRPSTTTNTGTNPGTNTSTILSAQPSAQPNAKPNAKQTPKQVPVPGSRRKRRCGIACDQINYNWGGDAWAEEWFIKEMQPNKRSVAALTTLKAISQDTMWKPGCGTPAGEMPGWLKILIEQKIRARSRKNVPLEHGDVKTALAIAQRRVPMPAHLTSAPEASSSTKTIPPAPPAAPAAAPSSALSRARPPTLALPPVPPSAPPWQRTYQSEVLRTFFWDKWESFEGCLRSEFEKEWQQRERQLVAVVEERVKLAEEQVRKIQADGAAAALLILERNSSSASASTSASTSSLPSLPLRLGSAAARLMRMNAGGNAGREAENTTDSTSVPNDDERPATVGDVKRLLALHQQQQQQQQQETQASSSTRPTHSAHHQRGPDQDSDCEDSDAGSGSGSGSDSDWDWYSDSDSDPGTGLPRWPSDLVTPK